MLAGGTDREDRADSTTAVQARCKRLTMTRQMRLLSDSTVGNALQLKAGTASTLQDRSALVITQIDLRPTE